MKYNFIILFLFISIVLYASVMHDDGIVGTTLLNGNGCVCHSPNFDASVSVWVEGPSQLTIGQTGVYNIYLTGGPMVDGGYNVAARFGTLGIVDTNSQIIDGELTHTYPLPFVGDTVHWTFNYTAPDSAGYDTIYSVANSVNGDGIPTTDDKWNFGPNFPVEITNIVPVELTSFNAQLINNSVSLNWKTATETNNKGFEVQKIKNSKVKSKNEWEIIGFINGNGTSAAEHGYSFNDFNLAPGNYQYRLKQIDFNGNFTYSKVLEVSVSPNSFSLSQNYPNPFNPSTNIGFSISDFGFVTLKVYNIQGKEVATLINKEMQPGSYQIKFDGSNLASGIYFYKLSSGNYHQVKKMILMK